MNKEFLVILVIFYIVLFFFLQFSCLAQKHFNSPTSHCVYLNFKMGLLNAEVNITSDVCLLLTFLSILIDMGPI